MTQRWTFDESIRVYAVPAVITFVIAVVFYIITRLALAFAGGSPDLAYIYAAVIGVVCWRIIAVGGPFFDNDFDERDGLFPKLLYVIIACASGLVVMVFFASFLFPNTPTMTMFAWIGTLVLFYFFRERPDDPDKHVRGPRQLDVLRQMAHASRRSSSDLAQQPHAERAIEWGGVSFPASVAHSAAAHYAVVGMTGSGKTLTLRMLMKSALLDANGRLAHRAVIYDPKGDMLSILGGMGVPAERIHVLNPFDERSTRWDIASDINEPALCSHAAKTMFPDSEEGEQYFQKAVRLLLNAVLIAFNQDAKHWTLYDAIEALSHPEVIRGIAESNAESRKRIRYVFTELLKDGGSLSGDRREDSVYATLGTELEPYRIVSALWEHAGRELSISGWMKDPEPSILVMQTGSTETINEALHAIYRVVFQQVAEHLIEQPEYPAMHTWFFLDEAYKAGKLPNLDSLLTMGRSKNVHVALGIQAIELFHSLYGEDEANGLLGQCGHLAALQVRSHTTAEWLSHAFGRFEAWSPTHGTTQGRDGVSHSFNESIQAREAVMASEFQTLPATNPTNGMSGFYIAPEMPGWWATQLAWPSIMALTCPTSSDYPDFIKRKDPTQQQGREWTDADLERLGLKLEDPEDESDEHEPQNVDHGFRVPED